MSTARRLHYGWVIVAAMFVVQTVSSGFGFYNMSVYITELALLLNEPVANISFAVSLFFGVGGVSGIYVARIIDRYPIVYLMVAGATGCGLSLVLMSFVQNLWQAYAVFALFGAANTSISLVVATTMVTRWFPGPNRSIALSIASTGLSMGGVVVTPFSAYLFNTFGIQASLPWLGVLFAALVIPIVVTLVRWPPSYQTSAAPEIDQQAYKAAVRSRFFVLLAAGYVFIMGAQVGGIAHLYNLVQGLSSYSEAALAVQLLTVGSISGRILGGWIMTRVPVRLYALANLLLQGVGLLVLSQADQVWLALVGAGLFGLSIGNLLMAQPLWLAEVFAADIYPRVYALANALTVIGVGLGPYFLGLMFDLADYATAYMVAAGWSVMAWFIVIAAGKGHPSEPVSQS